MAYKIKTKRRKETPIEKELEQFNIERKGKLPPIETYRVSSRIALRVPQRVYAKGNFVKYKNKAYHINRVTNEGIYIAKVQEGKQGFLKLSEKEKFIDNKKVYEGEVYPYYPYFAFGLF